MRSILYGLLGLLLASSANAASIEYLGTNGGVSFVVINGKIDKGDLATFRNVTASVTGPTVVGLASPGGNVTEALAIGATIRQRDYNTAVAAHDTCASACGLIWLAGKERFLTPSSSIGFHAAYLSNGDESGPGNAVVGAYLRDLGFPLETIVYITENPPDKMAWLTPADALKYQITYNLMPDSAPSTTFGRQTQNAPQQVPSEPTPSAPARSTREEQAVQFVLAYNAYWSQGGPNVEGLAKYYAPQINFYGTVVPREQVMDAKRKFSVRWPTRTYTVDQHSLTVECDASGCVVSGIVAWDCASAERSAHSSGTANFALRINDGMIVAENGSVRTRDSDPAPQASISSPAYAQGRQARIDYEQWISALPEGQYKAGALYWAAHRSERPQPNCAAESVEWQAGCIASRTRLATSDERRSTEKDYWAGWNSL